MRKFAAFILTHGRPENVITYNTLRACGYTGLIYIIIDNEDNTIEQYKNKFGEENVIIFDKKTMADNIDEANNFDNRKVIVHARNASFDIAKSLGLTHFVQLDDDYYFFGYRDEHGAKTIRNIDLAFSATLDFLDTSGAYSVAWSQGGDHIGGFGGIRTKRKAMNSFFCRVDRRFSFVGSMNEDVNTYVVGGSRGLLFFTFTGLQLDQKDTQSQKDGMTDIYLKHGTYIKSFTTVLFHPSSVRACMMSTRHKRMHHHIDWKHTIPCIVTNTTRKED